MARAFPAARCGLKHDPEKWQPVFGQDHAHQRKHDPEKWQRFSDKIMRIKESMIPKRGNR
jgi:hypothetical protein